ncbi:hypothetical protein Fot_37456 [Forsythia ovata]|uniref:Uncharacterized protein n=1 Tax=Forsythia ovata TaxID=205694 RepID=A0ABD1RZ12_9LAMI
MATHLFSLATGNACCRRQRLFGNIKGRNVQVKAYRRVGSASTITIAGTYYGVPTFPPTPHLEGATLHTTSFNVHILLVLCGNTQATTDPNPTQAASFVLWSNMYYIIRTKSNCKLNIAA